MMLHYHNEGSPRLQSTRIMSGFCALVSSGMTTVANLEDQICFGWPQTRSMGWKGNDLEVFGKHFMYNKCMTACTVLKSRVHLPSAIADVLTHLLFGFLSLYSWALKLLSVSGAVRKESDPSTSVLVRIDTAMLVCKHSFVFLCSICFLLAEVLTKLFGWTFLLSNCHVPPTPLAAGMNTGTPVLFLPELIRNGTDTLLHEIWLDEDGVHDGLNISGEQFFFPHNITVEFFIKDLVHLILVARCGYYIGHSDWCKEALAIWHCAYHLLHVGWWLVLKSNPASNQLVCKLNLIYWFVISCFGHDSQGNSWLQASLFPQENNRCVPWCGCEELSSWFCMNSKWN